jgi:hypothetical protein
VKSMPFPRRCLRATVAIGAALVGVVLFSCGACAGVNDAPRKVREGIEHYEAGRYGEAVGAFDEARQLRPDDARVLYDAACAKAAASKVDEAIELFQQAAVAPDVDLAAKCHYNLGRLAADRAKAILGEKPEEAETKARESAREFAASAIGHWRDCLATKPEHDDARWNLELTRLWLNHMEEAWKQADRRKRFEKMPLGEMLTWLEGQQGELRGATKSLGKLEPSPLMRLAQHQTSEAQRELGQDIVPLKQKIAREIGQPQPAQGCPPDASGTCGGPGAGGLGTLEPAEREHAVKVLSELADRAGESMQTAAEHLAERSPVDALRSQAEAIEGIDQINTAVMAYPDLVHKSVGQQKEVVGETESLGPSNATPDVGGSGTGAEPRPGATPSGPPLRFGPGTPAAEKAAGAESSKSDAAEISWRQRFVERWVPIMVAKARQGLEKMPPEEPKPKDAEKTSPAVPPPGATAGSPSSAGSDATGASAAPHGQDARATPAATLPSDAKETKPPEKVDPAEAARKQQEALRESMKRAVELGPEARRLVAEAATDLTDGRAADALPKQREALELLEKIAEPLKQPNQDQKNQQNQQNQQNQDKQDQNKDKQDQDQQKKDQNQDKEDQDKNKPQNQPKPDQQKQPKDQQPQAGQAPRQPRDLTKQQAEALMQQVRQRSREDEKARKELREMMSGPSREEKDW